MKTLNLTLEELDLFCELLLDDTEQEYKDGFIHQHDIVLDNLQMQQDNPFDYTWDETQQSLLDKIISFNQASNEEYFESSKNS